MKRNFKIFVNALLIVVLCVLSLGLFACEDLKRVEVNVSVYDISKQKTVTKTITIDLYRHLADETVDTIVDYAKKGYYDNSLFYVNKNTSETENAITFGDYKFDDSFNVIQNTASYVHNIKGEFEYNGTVGSDLINAKGYVGLWRDWTANNGYTTSDSSMNSGRASLYMPTTATTKMDGYFCVFGKIDLDKQENKEAFDLISAIFDDSTYYVDYTVYYTGEFDKTKSDENYGLTYGIMTSEDFNNNYDPANKRVKVGEDFVTVFAAEGEEYVSFNHHTVRIPIWNQNGKGNIATAKIESVKA